MAPTQVFSALHAQDISRHLLMCLDRLYTNPRHQDLSGPAGDMKEIVGKIAKLTAGVGVYIVVNVFVVTRGRSLLKSKLAP